MSELKQAIKNNVVMDYIASNYENSSKYELAEIIKEYSYFVYKKGFTDKEALKDLEDLY